MAAASGVTLAIESGKIPVIPGVLQMAGENQSGGMSTNREHFGPGIEFGPDIAPDLQHIVFDPQTSGGLLVAVTLGQAAKLIEALEAAGVLAADLGQVVSMGTKKLQIR
jgi:selenide,water dikinase